jgi:hypothetical protein
MRTKQIRVQSATFITHKGLVGGLFNQILLPSIGCAGPRLILCGLRWGLGMRGGRDGSALLGGAQKYQEGKGKS